MPQIYMPRHMYLPDTPALTHRYVAGHGYSYSYRIGYKPHATCHVFLCVLNWPAIYLWHFINFIFPPLWFRIFVIFFPPIALGLSNLPRIDPIDISQLGLAAPLMAYPLNATCAPLVRRAFWPCQPLEARFDPLKPIKADSADLSMLNGTTSKRLPSESIIFKAPEIHF